MKTLFVLILVSAPLWAEFSTERPWASRTRKTPAEKEMDKIVPPELRPNRPFHFYGNTIRRKIDKGYWAPRPSDWADNFRAYRKGRRR